MTTCKINKCYSANCSCSGTWHVVHFCVRENLTCSLTAMLESDTFVKQAIPPTYSSNVLDYCLSKHKNIKMFKLLTKYNLIKNCTINILAQAAKSNDKNTFNHILDFVKSDAFEEIDCSDNNDKKYVVYHVCNNGTDYMVDKTIEYCKRKGYSIPTLEEMADWIFFRDGHYNWKNISAAMTIRRLGFDFSAWDKTDHVIRGVVNDWWGSKTRLNMLINVGVRINENKSIKDIIKNGSTIHYILQSAIETCYSPGDRLFTMLKKFGVKFDSMTQIEYNGSKIPLLELCVRYLRNHEHNIWDLVNHTHCSRIDSEFYIKMIIRLLKETHYAHKHMAECAMTIYRRLLLKDKNLSKYALKQIGKEFHRYNTNSLVKLANFVEQCVEYNHLSLYEIIIIFTDSANMVSDNTRFIIKHIANNKNMIGHLTKFANDLFKNPWEPFQKYWLKPIFKKHDIECDEDICIKYYCDVLITPQRERYFVGSCFIWWAENNIITHDMINRDNIIKELYSGDYHIGKITIDRNNAEKIYDENIITLISSVFKEVEDKPSDTKKLIMSLTKVM